jgi:hypothetical protein
MEQRGKGAAIASLVAGVLSAGLFFGVRAWRGAATVDHRATSTPGAVPPAESAAIPMSQGVRTMPSSSAAARAAARARVDLMRAKIEALRAEGARPAKLPVPSAPAASTVARAGDEAAPAADELPSAMPAPVGSGNQAGQAMGGYVHDVVSKRFAPLLGECYGDLLRRHPGQAGKLVLDVNIVGDSSVGGVVESAKALPESTLKDEEFTTCVEESMMSIDFAPPPGDRNSVNFRYPFELAP